MHIKYDNYMIRLQSLTYIYDVCLLYDNIYKIVYV